LTVNRTWWRSLLVVNVMLMLVLAACTGPGESPTETDSDPGGGNGGVEGTVAINGSSTVEPVTSAVSIAFQEANAGFNYSVEGIGTGDGFDLHFCTGETDINDASRAIDEEEAAACADAGVEFVELLIGYDGITVFTHPDTALDCVTTADLYATFGPESSDLASWDDVEAFAAELGSSTDFPSGDLEGSLHAPGEESGTYTAFIELALADLIEERASEEALGTHYQPSPNDNVIVENVSAVENTMGFAGFAFYQENADRLKALSVDAGDGCIEPSIESIGDGSYPSARPLFIYVSLTKAAENPALVAFVDYYLSDDGITNVSGEGYIELPAEELEATRQAWEDAKP
jgi:phosphate transport system substrate-binding protein